MSAKKLTVKSVGKDKLQAIYLLLAIVKVLTELEVACLFIRAGVLVLLMRAPPRWFAQSSLTTAALTQVPVADSFIGSMYVSLLTQIGLFFAKTGAFIFCYGLAIVPLANRKAVR